MSGGAWRAASRSSAVLYDAARRLPEIARTRIGLLLHRRDADQELDFVGDQQPATGEGLVPIESELAAVKLCLDLEADSLVAPGIGAALGDCRDQLDRP